jgi:hypothetical protein
VCRGAGEMVIRECNVVVGEAKEHTTKSVSLREAEETANERRGCCLARTRRALLLLLKAMGASLEAILSNEKCGMLWELRCGFQSRIDDRLAAWSMLLSQQPITSLRFTSDLLILIRCNMMFNQDFEDS